MYTCILLFILCLVSSNKKRLVTAKSTLPKKINELEIICKVREREGGRDGCAFFYLDLLSLSLSLFQDLRKVVFSFKSCSKSDVVHVSMY